MDIDAQLLDRYARTRDADAFTQLVRRHAGMVFGVARRVTRDHHDAEEVAQGCFLELARQPAAIQGSVAGWLHRVATTRAYNCNRDSGRRRSHEQAAVRPEEHKETFWEEVAPLMDAALAELPEELRLPVMLYYLEGRKLRQVAAELRVSQSTVSRRLEAGVAALRENLQAAGLTAPSLALPGLLGKHAVVAAPKTLVAVLGKLAISGVVPGAGGVIGVGGKAAGAPLLHGGVSGGAEASSGAASGVTSGAVKGSLPLVAKIVAAVVMAGAVSTGGYVALRARFQAAVGVAQGGMAVAPYRGWVHIVNNPSGTEKSESFYNTETGQEGGFTQRGGKDSDVDATWTDPATLTVKKYDHTTRTIDLYDLPPSEVGAGKQSMWDGLTQRPNFTLGPAPDGGSGGRPFSYTDKETVGTSTNGTTVITGIAEIKTNGAVWIDPGTNLISRIDISVVRKDSNLSIESDYHYGDRNPTDIYDMGAPADATVVDHRMSDEVKAILASLAAQAAEGMGDGVGIVARSHVSVNPQSRRRPVPTSLLLDIKQGDSRLHMTFYSGKTKRDWANPKAVLPGGWPTPDLDEALKFADQLRCEELYVTDGHMMWRPSYSSSGTELVNTVVEDKGQLHDFPDLINEFLPDIRQYSDAWTTITQESRPDQPGLVGLRVREGGENSGGRLMFDDTYWLDPSRNYVPIEHDHKNYIGDRWSAKVQYLDFGRLPDGRWYPTHWRKTSSPPDGNPANAIDYRLTFSPGKTVDASWFSDPMRRFSSEGRWGRSDAPPAGGVAAVPRAVVGATVAAAHWVGSWWPWALAGVVFGAVGVMLILQRRGRLVAAPLRGGHRPRRR